MRDLPAGYQLRGLVANVSAWPCDRQLVLDSDGREVGVIEPAAIVAIVEAARKENGERPMAKWRVTLVGRAGLGVRTIEADSVSWPACEHPTTVRFMNEKDEQVAFVNTQYVATIERTND